MKLTIFNGSPRGSSGNTQTLLDRFIMGFMSINAEETDKNSYEVHNIKDIKSAEEAMNLFLNAQCVMFAFPLYVYAMPSGVMRLIEYLEPLCGKDGNPDMCFLVQGGFPEAIHSRSLEKYLDKLTHRLNSRNLGTIIKGGCEGLDVKPKFVTIPIFDGIRKIGKHFGENGTLDMELLMDYSKPERMGTGPISRMKAKFFIFMANRLFWKKKLEKNKALPKHGDRPYSNGKQVATSTSRSRLKKLGAFVVLIMVLMVSVMVINTMNLTSRQMKVAPAADVAVNSQEIAEHLSRAIQFKTLSYRDPSQFDYNEFISLHAYLEQAFPQVHSTLTKEVVGNYSLLYTWKGQEEGLKPIILMAHMDVVPIAPGTEGDWTHPPFEGRIADGYIWGRGTLDDKSSALGILEAVEILLKEGIQSRRTIYLAIGHDEEVGGRMGAANVADLLNSRGVKSDYILDEGAFVLDEAFPDMPPVAMLGIAEKGYLSLELTVEGKGGHSSMPPQHTAVGVLSTAIHNLEENPFPTKLDGAARQMFADYMAPEMSFPLKPMFANLWFFESGVVSKLSSISPSTNAWIRTTTAATMFEGSVQDNVLPANARAVVNFRILPGESIASVSERVRQLINDPRVKIKRLEQAVSEPSIVSDTSAPSFTVLQRTTHQIFPDVIVTPALTVVATDTRHFRDLSDNIYRFLPIIVKPADIDGIHGTNERISVKSYELMVRFYVQIIRNSAL